MIEAALVITLDDLTPLFGYELGDYFLLITSPDIRSGIKVATWSMEGCNLFEFTWLGSQSRQNLIAEFRKFSQANLRCSVLWITTDEYEHFTPSELTNVKIAAISFFSSPFITSNLQRILEITKTTNYQLQLDTESRMLDLLESARQIIFQCPGYGTQAVFDHHEAENWFSLHGPLEFGQQTVLPTGELSVLTAPSGQFDGQSNFLLEGQLLFQGVPVVHRSHPEISLSETLEQFRRLTSMRDFPVVASVHKGEIQNIYSPIKGHNPFLIELEQLFSNDVNYCKIHEIGFGTHPSCRQLVNDNFLPNERYPGIHFGLGLGGTTKFHIDLICTGIEVFLDTKSGKALRKLYF